MLAAEGLLQALNSKEDNIMHSDNDYDFLDVLKEFSDDVNTSHRLRYANGSEENFSFDID